MLDIHATDQGWQGGQWSALLPGGVTHTNYNSQQNLIVDGHHPATSSLSESNYAGWGSVSHGYFTNLYAGTNTILTDENSRPTTIEYSYANTNVLATMQTLEYGGSNPIPLKNTLAYTLRKAGIMPGYEKLLLLKDSNPWNSTAIEDTLTSWGISYVTKTSSEFAALDLSPYSAIVIASDQTTAFYENIAANISRLEGFTAPGYTPTFVFEIFSSNNENTQKVTYDGGAYRGYVAGTTANNTIAGIMYAIYVDPSGNAGILKGALAGTGGITWNTAGSIYPVQIAANTGILAADLYGKWGGGDMDYKYGAIGSGTFAAGGTISGNYISLEGADIALGAGAYTKWGVWDATTSGTYNGTIADSWSCSIPSLQLEPGSFTIGLETTGTQWSNNRLAGSVRGYWAEACSNCTSETGIFIGETLGTFDANAMTWQAVQSGVWLETNQLLEMAGKNGGTPNIAALEQLNIPAVEVGRANLTGSGNNLTVNMNNVIFLAPSTGAAPSIWATGTVSGSYTANPAIGQAVTLTGNGLTTAFTPSQWANGKWLATVSGNGTYSGTGSMNGNNIQLQGAGAGGFGAGIFTGTAAGTAAPAPAN